MVTMHKRAMYRKRQEWLVTFRARQLWAEYGGYVVGGLMAIVIVAMVGVAL